LSGPVWAGDKTGQSAVQIYNTEDVIAQAAGGDKNAPEEPKPMPMESNGTATDGGCSSCCESGLLQEALGGSRSARGSIATA